MVDGRLHTTLQHLRRLAASDPGGVSDAQLLERFVAGREEAAFELLVWRHERMVLGVCRRILGDGHAAEDAFQATFFALARRAGSIGRREAVGAWLYRVALRAALRARCRAAAHPHLPTPTEEDLPPANDLSPVDAAALRELASLLDTEVGRLPEKYRLPVILCYFEGKTYDEAARDLGCTRGTVSTRLHRARDLLRARLVRRGLSLSAVALATFLTTQGGTAAPALIQTTVRGATLFAAGAASPTVPAHVVALTEGVLKAMSMSKIQLIAGCLLLGLAVSLGVGGVLAQRDPVRVPVASEEKSNPAEPGSEEAWRERFTFASDAQDVNAVAFSPDGKMLAFVDDRGTLNVLDVASGKLLMKIETKVKPLMSVAFSPDGKWLAAAGGEVNKPGAVGLWEVGRGTEKLTVVVHGSTVTHAAFSPDGKLLATTSEDGGTLLLDGATGEKVRILPGSKDTVFSAVFSPDGKLLVTVGGPQQVNKENNPPGEVKLWDVETGKEVRSLSGHLKTVAAAAFSPDGKALATGSFDHTVAVWDVATGKALAKCAGHEFFVRSLAFSPDGKMLATGSFDETVRLWAGPGWKERAVLRGHRGIVLGVAISPDGRFVASCSSRTRFKAGGRGVAEVKVWEMVDRPGAKVPELPRGGEVERKFDGGGRLEQLVAELVKVQRGDEACVEALCLATLGRFPTEAERKFAVGHLAKAADRRKALSDVLFTLVNTREFREHAAELSKQAALPIK